MRITDTISYRNFLANVNMLNERLESASERVASGKRLLHLRDSPADSSEVLQLQSQLSQIDQYRTNADNAGFYLQVSESALNSLYNLVSTAFTQGSAAANSYNDADARASYAAEIRSLSEEIFSLSNSQVRGRYLFSGSQVTTPAFAMVGGVAAYQGDDEVNTVDVSAGLQVEQNVLGSDAFGAVFPFVQSLLTAVENGDGQGIQAALDQFSATLTSVNEARARLGVNLARVQDSELIRQAQQTNIQERESHISDADVAAAFTEMNQLQTALQASFAAGSLIGRKTLFDYFG
jgi:flagellar hook-associated protein 3 FlgL